MSSQWARCVLPVPCIYLGPREAYFNARPLGRLDTELSLQLLCQHVHDVQSERGLMAAVFVLWHHNAVVFHDQLQCIVAFPQFYRDLWLRMGRPIFWEGVVKALLTSSLRIRPHGVA